MAMGWLKGLVAPTAFGDNAQQQPGMPGMQQPGGPPMGGSPYMQQPNMPPPGTPPIGAPGGPAPYDASALPNPMQWSTGTRTQGAGQQQPQGGVSGGGVSGGGVSGGGVSGGGVSGGGVSGGGVSGGQTVVGQSLEARCAQLQADIDSLALFARTLLTMLEENKVVSREQFDATKHRLDMLDGKLDDR